MFRRKSPSRSDRLAAAAKAHSKGRKKKAAALYEELLKGEPNDADLHRKAAPALARVKHPSAWKSFRIAAGHLAEQGFMDKAIGVYREAAHYLPRELDAWMAIANLEVERGRTRDAASALREGRKHFKGRKVRTDAIRLLTRARDLDATDFESGLDLARLWRKTGSRETSWNLLEDIRRSTPGRSRLRRIRSAQFHAYSTPAGAFRWLRAIVLGR